MSQYQSIVILTGAGISAESGIRTFRASDGLWEDHRIEDVASPEGYLRDPQLVHQFYNQRRSQLLSDEVAPNPGHQALARLEREFAGDFLLVTQNIDNLHERAGSQSLLHMHGELLSMRCEASELCYEQHSATSPDDICLCCQQPGNLRPDIVWFGEMPMYMEQIYTALASCDLFISIGTSGNVYPAAGFVEMANQAGAHTLELNLEPSLVQSQFKEHRYGPAGQLLPLFVDELLSAS